MAAGDWDRCFTALLHYFLLPGTSTPMFLGREKSSTSVAAAAAAGKRHTRVRFEHFPPSLWSVVGKPTGQGMVGKVISPLSVSAWTYCMRRDR